MYTITGEETGVLENFPWNDITVDVWMVEHKFHLYHEQKKRFYLAYDEKFVKM